MIRHDVEQGSAEWQRLRLGIPTASQFGRIVTEKTQKLAAGRVSYMHELLAERILGHPLDGGSSLWMERGTALEERARLAYEFERGAAVERVGFCTDDAGDVGASTDGLVSEDGIIEIKCRKAEKHVAALLTNDYTDIAKASQVQGGLWVTGREWADVVAYNDAMPPRIIRVERDPEWMAALDEHLPAFLAEIAEAWHKLEDDDCVPHWCAWGRDQRGNAGGPGFANPKEEHDED